VISVKKKLIILSCSIIFLLLLSGCTENQKEQIEDIKKNVTNSPPVAIINADGIIKNPPEYLNMGILDGVAYDGKTIIFDASDSYDSDGDSLSYEWIWADSSTSTGVRANKVFEIDDVKNLDGFSMVYSVTLVVSDGRFSSLASYKIGIIPEKIKLYFSDGELLLNKPDTYNEKIRIGFGKIKNTEGLEYILTSPIKIQNCKYVASIYIEKPRFSIINKISFTLINNSGETIDTVEDEYGLPDSIWKEKTIEINGEINQLEELKKIIIDIDGFSIRNKVDIYYGGVKDSNIVFDYS